VAEARGAYDYARGSYVKLSYADKARYYGQGFVYHPKNHTSDDTWYLEWSSGTRKSSGKIRYRKLAIRGTRQQARDLLDIIVQLPHKTYAEGSAAIEPYIEWHAVPRSGTRVRHAKECIPSVPTAYQMQNRERIIRDYQRLKLLDIMVNICRELGKYECEGDGVGVETTALRA
jgi:hypothetical protein